MRNSTHLKYFTEQHFFKPSRNNPDLCQFCRLNVVTNITRVCVQVMKREGVFSLENISFLSLAIFISGMLRGTLNQHITHAQ